MSPTVRRWSGRSTSSSTNRSSSRIATRVSRWLPLIRISRFKCDLSRPKSSNEKRAPQGCPPPYEEHAARARRCWRQLYTGGRLGGSRGFEGVGLAARSLAAITTYDAYAVERG